MKRSVLILVAGFFSTSASAQGPKEQEGQIIGGFLGGIVSMVPGGTSVAGQVVRSMAPTVGTLVGGAIGAQLDEEDRRALAAATSRAFNSGSKQSFRGKSGRGTVTVVENKKNDAKQPCRTVRQDVILASGQTLSDSVSACKGPKGWQI
jgi:surface antigen